MIKGSGNVRLVVRLLEHRHYVHQQKRDDRRPIDDRKIRVCELADDFRAKALALFAVRGDLVERFGQRARMLAHPDLVDHERCRVCP